MLCSELDFASARRRLKARRLEILVRYQTEAVFRNVVAGRPIDDDDSWMALVTEDDAVRLLRIFEALRRIDLGTYGMCDSCKTAIEVARLGSEPEAHLCAVCALFTGALGST